MLMMDESASVEELRENMLEAAEGVHTALVTYAARDSEYDGYDIRAGEYLALMDGALLGSFKELDSLFAAISDRAEEFSPSVLSVYYGEDVTGEEAEKAASGLAERFPDAEMSVVNGGQPVYYYMVSIE